LIPSEALFTSNRIQRNSGIKGKGNANREALKLMREQVELANKFLPTIVVEIRDHRNTVAFKTPMVAKKPPC